MALSMDIRRRVIKAWQAGHSTSQIVQRFEISERTVREFKRRWRENRLEPQRSGPRYPTKITPEDEAIIRQQIASNPGVTLQQLSSIISVQVAQSTIHRTLKRMNISLKKSR